ncbi:MAG TPA: ethanolamine ammonia-lyase subunit EutC [Roseiarcus sp.]|jgi:ethanolamine ammonia-lyase small subunit
MEEPKPLSEIDRLWAKLRAISPARIGLARSGAAVATRDLLAFQLAHAQARDAVNDPFDAGALAADIEARGLDAVRLASSASDRHAYLARPDLGRRLDEASRHALTSGPKSFDIAFVVADGLSAKAVAAHARPLLDTALPVLIDAGWRIGPVAIVERGRVAIGDEIGELMGATLVAVLIGERPGLTTPNSLGVYLTFAPKVGRRDAERNCLSNIHPQGMSYEEAAARLAYLCAQARQRKLTGVLLKDESTLRRPIEKLP